MRDGALLVDKPVGPSSNAVLQRVKKLFAAKKAGHAGTLDPLASGLLIVLLGEATKFAGPLLDAGKEYVAALRLGETTATGDAEGEVLQQKEVNLPEKEIESVLTRFRGEMTQLPPMHSALKCGGVPLYKLARKGESVERKARRIEIFELKKLRFEPPFLDIQVRCSKGTYIRTLAEDIGAALGTGAHLASLRRTAAGRFRIEQASRLEELQDMNVDERDARLLPLSSLLEDLPRAQLEAVDEARLRNGQALKISGLQEGLHAVYRPDGGVIGLGHAQNGSLRPLRLTQAAEKHR